MTRAARSASANLIDEKTLRGRKLVSTRFSRRNEIEVRLPSSSERTDADVAKATIQALEWDAFIPPGKVKITLDKGRVTLEGSWTGSTSGCSIFIGLRHDDERGLPITMPPPWLRTERIVHACSTP